MSTVTDIWPEVLDKSVTPASGGRSKDSHAVRTRQQWSEHEFADEQLRNLVRQLFSPGWPTPMCQVAFCPVESEANVLAICTRLARTLAAQTTGTVCVVNTAMGPGIGNAGRRCIGASENHRLGNLRDLSSQLTDRTWVMAREIFLNEKENTSLVALRARLAEIRLEFDYTIVCGPPASSSGEAELLASMCEGVVLVLQANSTRRIAAQKVIQRLRAANVSLLGTVLSNRRFPVPDAIYRRL